MKSNIIVFGGSGYIGSHFVKKSVEENTSSFIQIGDLNTPNVGSNSNVSYSASDVRESIDIQNLIDGVDWIINLAAIHREPGHKPHEYFETNIKGARNVCEFAERVGCKNILFTSSIAVYGPTHEQTDENTLTTPNSPYGSSKLAAELIHEAWQKAGEGRRLIICRPGVIYGPGDPGNILRMIQAIQKGYFAFPGSTKIYKSYGYIHGLLDSFEYFMKSDYDFVKYNYVEYPTETIGRLAEITKEELNSKAPVFSLPKGLLLSVARFIQRISGDKSSIHPRRVEKAAMPTHIIPQVLINEGFDFKYDFRTSLRHWMKEAPEDFE